MSKVKKKVGKNIKDSEYTLLPEDDIILCDRRNNDTAINLLCIKEYPESKIYTIKKTSQTNNSVTIYPYYHDKFKDSDMYTLSISEVGEIKLWSDGESWSYEQVDIGGGTDLSDEQIRTINHMIPIITEGAVYYREGSNTNPIEGDRRDVGNGLGRNIDEVFDGNEWSKKIEVGSVGTDSITLREGLNDIKVKDDKRCYNVARLLKTMNGLQIGSSFTPLALTGEETSARYYYPDTNEEFRFIGVGAFDEEVSLPSQMFLQWSEADSIVKAIELKTSRETRVRLRMYKTNESDAESAFQNIKESDIVYESMPDNEYKNEEGKNYGGNIIGKGDSIVPLGNEMYLTRGKNYVLVFEGLEKGNFLGKDGVPYFVAQYYKEKVTMLASDESVETRLSQDIVLDRNMWLSSRSKPKGKQDKGDPINLIGTYEDSKTVVGNDYDITKLVSKDKIEVLVGTNDTEHLATEEWVVKQGGSQWNPKIVNYAEGDNIIVNCRRDIAHNQITFPPINFDALQPTQDRTVRNTLNAEYGGMFDIPVVETEVSNHAVLKSVTISGIPLKVGQNTNIKLKSGENEIVYVVTGERWSLDGGDTWKGASYSPLKITLDTSFGIAEIPMFEKDGRINPQLL